MRKRKPKEKKFVLELLNAHRFLLMQICMNPRIASMYGRILAREILVQCQFTSQEIRDRGIEEEKIDATHIRPRWNPEKDKPKFIKIDEIEAKVLLEIIMRQDNQMIVGVGDDIAFQISKMIGSDTVKELEDTIKEEKELSAKMKKTLGQPVTALKAVGEKKK